MRRRPHFPALFSTAVLSTALSGALAVVLLAAPAAAEPWPGHPGRDVVRHVVQPGDTATGLAVHYHAWTAELLALNGLSEDSYLIVGETLRIPVVVAAARKAAGGKEQSETPKQADRREPAASRVAVKRLIAAEARRQGVPVRLAQAVGWMESGWYQPVVSSANAIGVMQVLPTTGTWMSMYAGRPLDLRDTRDNILAGVLLLKVLADNTDSLRETVGAYYQGLGAVERHGLYDETESYVDNVLALRERVRSLPD